MCHGTHCKTVDKLSTLGSVFHAVRKRGTPQTMTQGKPSGTTGGVRKR